MIFPKYPNDLGIKDKSIIWTLTTYCWLLLQIYCVTYGFVVQGHMWYPKILMYVKLFINIYYIS